MKKLAALLMVFSLALFNVGCEPADDAGTTDNGAATTTDDDAATGTTPDTTEGEASGAG